jgi:hypothetical protein
VFKREVSAPLNFTLRPAKIVVIYLPFFPCRS